MNYPSLRTDILELFAACAPCPTTFIPMGCRLAPMPRVDTFDQEVTRARRALAARRAPESAGPTEAAKARKRARNRVYMALRRQIATAVEREIERRRQQDKQRRLRARRAAA